MRLFDFTSSCVFPPETDPSTFAEVRTARGREMFPAAVLKAGWRHMKRGDAFIPEEHGVAVVIGVATWSQPELDALELLVSASREVQRAITVFDVDEIESLDQFSKFLPNVKPKGKTPVVATYEAATLLRSFQGADALDWLHMLAREGYPASRLSER